MENSMHRKAEIQERSKCWQRAESSMDHSEGCSHVGLCCTIYFERLATSSLLSWLLASSLVVEAAGQQGVEGGPGPTDRSAGSVAVRQQEDTCAIRQTVPIT
eukprot:4620899-Amphidinium_carterae.2